MEPMVERITLGFVILKILQNHDQRIFSCQYLLLAPGRQLQNCQDSLGSFGITHLTEYRILHDLTGIFFCLRHQLSIPGNCLGDKHLGNPAFRCFQKHFPALCSLLAFAFWFSCMTFFIFAFDTLVIILLFLSFRQSVFG